MKILYITHARLFSRHPHTYQVLKTCNSFSAQGHEVELVVPSANETGQQGDVKEVWQHYEITHPFKITRLPSLDLTFISPYLRKEAQRVIFYCHLFTFSILAVLYAFLCDKDITYTRTLVVCILLSLLKASNGKLVFEAHLFRRRWKKVMFFKNVNYIVVTTGTMLDLYSGILADSSRILLAPNGVDLSAYESMPSRFEAREKLQIARSGKIICYSGGLYRWKGVYTLVESAKYLPDSYHIIIVGGMEEDISNLREFVAEKGFSNVSIVGYVNHVLVPTYLAASDVVVVPQSARTNPSNYYTCPIKLLEYMAAKRPVIASNLPCIKEILEDGENALLVEPDSPQALSERIKEAVENKALSRKISEQAYVDVLQKTWNKRGEKILRFIKV